MSLTSHDLRPSLGVSCLESFGLCLLCCLSYLCSVEIVRKEELARSQLLHQTVGWFVAGSFCL